MSTPAPADLPTALAARFPGVQTRPSADLPAVDVPRDRLLEILRALRDEEGYDFLVDLTAVDWESRSPRFTAVYHLFGTRHHRYLRVACDCAGDEDPAVPSVTSLWPGADWLERETYDLMGVRFPGHPDLRRILMWDEYPYHPLRKEFPLAGIDVPLPGADVAEETGVGVKPAPMMGGPFVASQEGGRMSRAEPRARDESWTEASEKPAGEAGA